MSILEERASLTTVLKDPGSHKFKLRALDCKHILHEITMKYDTGNMHALSMLDSERNLAKVAFYDYKCQFLRDYTFTYAKFYIDNQ